MTSAPPNHRLQPFLKWAGGKGQLLDQFEPFFPSEHMRNYYEPFVGSGAVFFHLRPRNLFEHYHLSDVNCELITCYRVIRDQVDDLITLLAEHNAQHCHKHYYAVREKDRDPAWADQPDVIRAARMIYLNKTCYNGLWRVNSEGHFNVPMGRYTRPAILDEPRLRAASAALQGVTLSVREFDTVENDACEGDFVYFDPPYVPLSATANFTSYAKREFGPDQQRALATTFATLAQQDVRVMLSNSDTPFVRDLYAGFRVETVTARRMINSAKRKRGTVNEVVVLGDP
jgi:DNA adenine methylase